VRNKEKTGVQKKKKNVLQGGGKEEKKDGWTGYGVHRGERGSEVEKKMAHYGGPGKDTREARQGSGGCWVVD